MEALQIKDDYLRGNLTAYTASQKMCSLQDDYAVNSGNAVMLHYSYIF